MVHGTMVRSKGSRVHAAGPPPGFPIRDGGNERYAYIPREMKWLPVCAAAIAAVSALVCGAGPAVAHEPVDPGALDEAALAAHLEDHPEDHDARVRLGWARYRRGAFTEARVSFDEALRRAPASIDARVGLAYVLLQTGAPGDAAAAFEAALGLDPGNGDALRGLALAGTRPGAPEPVARAAAAAARRLVDSDPRDDQAALALAVAERATGGEGEVRRRPDAAVEGPPAHAARAGHDFLEVRGKDGGWRPVFVKGINLGAALPGRFPTEFPTDEETWREWIGTIADLGANAVRAYTLLPPAFYEMLAERNAMRPDADRIWLLQGVWTELPPRHDFSDPEYEEAFRAEIARVVDAVHGDLVLAPRPGHASGVYAADVSRHTLAWIVGREWEPFAVLDHEALHPGPCAFEGTFVATAGGRAMECFVARILEFTADYEARRHGAARPLTFANWPTLDPLSHPTESNRAEEEAWRRRLGLPFVEAFRDEVWDNDAATLDATKIRGTAAFPAGVFASYHIYPNYPDFLNHDPRYADARDAEGPSRYAGYLRELKAYHGAQPVLVAEFGVSTSRGIAHVQPEGWHHGGHDERKAMALVARLLRSIRDERMAGGLVFSFQDEWFKGTWSVAPFEIPAENRRLWFNAESPEQSYGLVARRPSAPVRVDGDPSEWPASAALVSSRRGSGWTALRSLSALSDEGYLYLLLRTAGGPAPPDWERVRYAIALDRHDPARGARAIETLGAELPSGAEFVVEIAGPEKSAVRRAEAGRLLPLLFETNRERIARDGTRIPAIVLDRGALRFGSLDPSSPAFDTRTDVAIGEETGTIEMRLPWDLLDVSDPSSHRVLLERIREKDPLETAVTEGFRLYAFAAEGRSRLRATSRLPETGAARAWRWPGWKAPRYRSGLKHGIEALVATFQAIDGPDPEEAGP